MSDEFQDVSGSCLCGGVHYRVRAFTRPVVACHCTQCRKTSGHHVAATKAMNADIEMLSDDTLAWYRSSEGAERGFCNRCGGNVFWRAVGGDATSIMVQASGSQMRDSASWMMCSPRLCNSIRPGVRHAPLAARRLGWCPVGYRRLLDLPFCTYQIHVGIYTSDTLAGDFGHGLFSPEQHEGATRSAQFD